MLSLLWIQTVWNSDGISKKVDVEKNQQTTQRMKITQHAKS